MINTPESATDADSTAGPRTLRRGLQVLNTLREHGHAGLSVTGLARATGLQRPTIYRLLAALVESGLVKSLERSKRFACSLDAPQAPPSGQDPRIELALPAMQRLAQATGDAVFLVVREGHESLSLWREIGPYPVQILAAYAGKRQPLGVGSGGMALLAALPDAEVERIIECNGSELELYGGMTAREMRRLVENTRMRGYSVVGNHAVRGALGVGCALCDKRQSPLLAISVTAITERMPAQRQREIAGLIRAELAEIAQLP